MLNQDNSQNVDNPTSASPSTASNPATDNNSSLEDKAAQVVEIINSDKSEQEKSDQVWEILKNV